MPRKAKTAPRWVLDEVREIVAELIRDGLTSVEAMSVLALAGAAVGGEIARTAIGDALKGGGS